MEWIPVIIGLVLIFQGFKAIRKQSVFASPEGEDEREYRGVQALIIGLLWIAIGLFLAVTFAGPMAGCGACGRHRAFLHQLFT